jgi:hypothetical protein
MPPGGTSGVQGARYSSQSVAVSAAVVVTAHQCSCRIWFPHAWSSRWPAVNVNCVLWRLLLLLMALPAVVTLRAVDLPEAELREAAVKAATLAADLAQGYLQTREYVDAAHFADVADKAAAKSGDEKFAAAIKVKTDAVRGACPVDALIQARAAAAEAAADKAATRPATRPTSKPATRRAA